MKGRPLSTYGKKTEMPFCRQCPCIEPENRRVCGLPLLSQQSQKDRLKRCAHPLAGSSSPPPPSLLLFWIKTDKVAHPFRRQDKETKKRVTEAWSRNFTISKGNACLTSLTDYRLCLFSLAKSHYELLVAGDLVTSSLNRASTERQTSFPRKTLCTLSNGVLKWEFVREKVVRLCEN
mgnify:CR=1 FL=1